MGDNRVPVGERMGHEVIICDLEEGIHGRGLVALAGGPGADPAERGQIAASGLTKKLVPRSTAQVASSSAPASISSPTFSILKTRPAALCAMSQSQNAGQKSRP